MIETEGSVSPKGQVTIPTAIRKELGIKPGDRVAISLKANEVTIRRLPSPLDASYQAVPALRRPISLEEMEAIIAEEAALAALAEGT